MNQVYSIAMSNDSKYVASGDTGNTIIIWEVSTSKILRKLEGHYKEVNIPNINLD